MTVNEGNHAELLLRSETLPVFILLFSPYCGHCKAIHPTWEKLMEEHDEDPDIVVAEIDCVDNRNICLNVHKANGYPTFEKVIKSKIEEIQVTRTKEAFEETVKELKNTSYDIKFGIFPADAKSYPVSVFGSMPNTSINIEKLVKVSHELGVFNHRFFMSTGEFHFRVYFDQTRYIEPKNGNSISDIVKLINRHMIPLFQPFNKSILSEEGQLAVLITDKKAVIDDFKKFCHNYSEYFVFQHLPFSLIESKLNALALKIDDDPLLVLSNKDKTKWKVIRNAFIDASVLTTISEATKDDFAFEKNDKVMFLLDGDGVRQNDKMTLSITNASIVSLIVSFAIFSIVAIWWYYNHRSIPKIE